MECISLFLRGVCSMQYGEKHVLWSKEYRVYDIRVLCADCQDKVYVGILKILAHTYSLSICSVECLFLQKVYSILQKQVCNIDHGVYKNESQPVGQPTIKVCLPIYLRYFEYGIINMYILQLKQCSEGEYTMDYI